MSEADKFSPAPPEVTALIERLIAAHFSHLAEARFELRMRDAAISSYGNLTWAEADTADNDAEKGQFDFTIWFAADIWQGMTDWQREALALHELCHCSWDDKGKPLLVVHDIEEFNLVVANYGLWWDGADETLAALQVMPAPQGPEGVNEMAVNGAYQRPMGAGGGNAHTYQRPMLAGGGNAHTYQQPMLAGGPNAHTYQAPMLAGGPNAHTYQSPMLAGGPNAHTYQAPVAWSDPGIVPGGDYHSIPLPDGTTLELCPACYEAVKQQVLNDLQGALGV